jgi:FkbH-like protein
MFETEVDHVRLTPGALPPEVLAEFRRERAFTHLGRIKWEEHCTECAWPACYTSCDLYNPRSDGNCRRTLDGFAPVVGLPVLGAPVVRVRFKRWGHLTARCEVAGRPAKDVEKTERRMDMLSSLAARLPVGAAVGRPGLPSRAVRRLKDRIVDPRRHAEGGGPEPTCFVMEIYNPAQTAVALSLDIAGRHGGGQIVPFKRLLSVEPGFQAIRLPFEEIRPHLGGAREADVLLNPNVLTAEEEGLTLFLGLMAFARETPPAQAPAGEAGRKIKVVIWDLDNTVWDGTLIEDGPGNVRLKPGVLETIQALDARGIVSSVASKNHERDALAEIERLGLRDYFVFSEISWGRKSEAVRRIVQSFNVGEDTVAFIDDQPFEREEVRSGNPRVRIYRHDEVAELLARAEFDVPATPEAQGRRRFYQNEAVRQQAMHQALEQPGTDYLEFLRRSNIRVTIAVASGDLLERVHELVQRTNQMNFSGYRYGKDDLRAMLSDDGLECFLVDAEDDYGKYGCIGFAAVRRGPVPHVQDLAFSCRVQAKRVEHAVLTSFMEYYAGRGARTLEVFYRGTERNALVAKVFGDLEFVEASRDGADVVYERSLTAGIPANDVVHVRFPASLVNAK